MSLYDQLQAFCRNWATTAGEQQSMLNDLSALFQPVGTFSASRLLQTRRRRAKLQPINGRVQWRADFQDELIIWFHADLESDPRKIIIAYDKPTQHEYDCADFIVNAPADVENLLNAVDYLQRENARLKLELEWHKLGVGIHIEPDGSVTTKRFGGRAE